LLAAADANRIIKISGASYHLPEQQKFPVFCLDGKRMLQKTLQIQHGLETVNDQFAAFSGLVDRGTISGPELEKIVRESEGSGRRIEESILSLGIPKHEILLCLSEHYCLPFVEFNENLPAPGEILGRLDLEELKRDLWFPLSVGMEEARIAAFSPCDPELHEKIEGALGALAVRFIVALPSDLIR